MLVADTGFYSSSNVSALDTMGIFYIISLGVIYPMALCSLSMEFVCYGYKKTAKQLNRLGYEINRKKELDLISMVSPNATINIVENFVIKEKFNVFSSDNLFTSKYHIN